MLTLMEGRGDRGLTGKPRSQSETLKESRGSEWAWAGSDLPAEQANGQVVVERRGGLVGRGGGGKEGGW